MIFCSNCFCDIEIVSIIKSLNNIGTCPTCRKSGVFLYDTEKNDQLSNKFYELISIYSPIDSLPSDYPKSNLYMLKDELSVNWNIFNKLSPAQVYDIVKVLSPELYSESPSSFNSPVGIMEKYDTDYLHENSILRTNNWDDFVNELKYKNRFHTSYINTRILEVFCSYIRKIYRAGELFYRGRISPEAGYLKDEMGAPPREKAIEGRVNSAGISRLYLASDVDTTIHEVRASAFDIITVGTFKLKEDITVVDLKNIDKISPFIEDLNCLQYAINKEHLNKINDELGKTLRRSDSKLDYIPTQFISDFIKSITHANKAEYAGIEYNSTMNPNGYNLSIFYPHIFECIAAQTYRIDELTYKKSEI